jgi:hypothetical protein
VEKNLLSIGKTNAIKRENSTSRKKEKLQQAKQISP